MDDIKSIDFDFDSSFIIGLEGQRRNYDLFYYHPNDLFIDQKKISNTIDNCGFDKLAELEKKQDFMEAVKADTDWKLAFPVTEKEAKIQAKVEGLSKAEADERAKALAAEKGGYLVKEVENPDIVLIFDLAFEY